MLQRWAFLGSVMIAVVVEEAVAEGDGGFLRATRLHVCGLCVVRARWGRHAVARLVTASRSYMYIAGSTQQPLQRSRRVVSRAREEGAWLW